MDRSFAHGMLEVRAVDDGSRTFEGVANSASEDSHGTVIEPAGAVYKLPIPLFFHAGGRHSHDSPIGEVIAAEVRNGLLWVRGVVRKIEDDGTEGGRDVKRRLDAAWADIKAKLVRGLSIEFVPIEPKSPHARRWTRWQWRGLAVVPVPSNMDATIQLVRSIAAAGESLPPGHSGLPNETPTPRGRTMTTREQIQQHENSRAAKVARQTALMERSATEGTTLAPNEAEEYDTLTAEIEAIDGHITRLSVLERSQAAKVTPVPAVPGSKPAAEARGGVPVVQVRDGLPAGIGMARYAMALMACRGNRYEAAEYARNTWGDSAEAVALHLRAPVAAGTTTDATWAAPLVPTNFLNEFLEMLRPATLIGRIPGLRRVPFNISMPSQTAGGTYQWVGEGKAKPITKADFSAVTLGMAKAAGIIVLTKELVKSSSPSAQEVVRDEMVKGIGAFLDQQFIDPTKAVDGVISPASITNGVAGNPSSGSTEAQIRADVLQLLGGFTEGNFGLGGVVLLMSEASALALGMVINAVGQPAFPGIQPTGGSLMGIPVVTSNTVGDQIIAVHAPSVLFADEGGVELDVSEQASLEMESAPTEPTAAATVLVSLYQRNLIALRAERFINWKKARDGAVRRITDVDYVPADAS